VTRHGARILFGLGVVSVVAVFAAVAVAALTPKPGARIEAQDIGLVSLASLRDGVPAFVTMHDDVGLDVQARDLRSRGLYYPMGGRGHLEELPIWVVKSGDGVRAFMAIDPRNGCSLEVLSPAIPKGTGVAAFHDVCHGSLYAIDGSHVGGPSPWTLDQLVVSIRGDIVYADRHGVLPGKLIPQ
jgi:Rieske Fe-S protein